MSLPPCGFEALRSSTAICHQNYRVWYCKGKPGFLEPQLEPALNSKFPHNGARICPRGSGFLNLLCCIFLLRLPAYLAHHVAADLVPAFAFPSLCDGFVMLCQLLSDFLFLLRVCCCVLTTSKLLRGLRRGSQDYNWLSGASTSLAKYQWDTDLVCARA